MEQNQQSAILDQDPDKLWQEVEENLRLLSRSVSQLYQIMTPREAEKIQTRLDEVMAVGKEILDSQTSSDEAVKQTESEGQMLHLLQELADKQTRNDKNLLQYIKENATFQVQVRQGMQKELDTLREQLRSEQFNPILRSIATIYVEYQSLLNENGLSEQAGRNLDSLFEELRDILEENGAEIIRSEVGTVRQNKVCKVIKKIPTGDKAKHNTIAHSRKPGVVRDRTVLYHEYVDGYVYDPTMAAEPEHAASVPDAAPLAAGMTETASDQAAAADTAFTEPLPAASIDQTAEPAAGAADAASPVAGTGASEPVMPAAGTADDASESAPVPAPSRLPTDDAPAMPAAGTDEPAWPSESAAETTMDKDR